MSLPLHRRRACLQTATPGGQARAGRRGLDIRSTHLFALAAAGAGQWSLPVAAQDVATPGAVASEDRARAVQCLATAIAYEAGYEPDAGQQAVAEVILNRVRTPLFPKSVCGVVFAGSERRTGCQFSFTCDGSLRRRMPDAVLARARAVAEAALDGRNPARVGGAAWYHADYVYPYWAPSLVRVVKIGAHIFYRAPGMVDRPGGGAALTPSAEPVIAALAGVQLGAASAATPAAKAEPEPSKPFAPWGLAAR